MLVRTIGNESKNLMETLTDKDIAMIMVIAELTTGDRPSPVAVTNKFRHAVQLIHTLRG